MENQKKQLYDAVLRPKYEKLKAMYTLDAKNGWEVSKDKFGVITHTKKDPQKSLNYARGEGKIHAPASIIAQELLRIEDYPLWDRTLEATKHIETIDDYMVGYAQVKKMPAVSTRESLSVNKLFYESNGIIIGVAASIEHPDCPVHKQNVRVDLCIIGWILIPDDQNPNSTNVVYILQIDPKGWLPKSLYNIFCDIQALNVGRLRNYIQGKFASEKNGGLKTGEEAKSELKEDNNNKTLEGTSKKDHNKNEEVNVSNELKNKTYEDVVVKQAE